MPLKIRYPDDLPVAARREEILAAIKNHQVVVIAGATGSGKTTQIPKMCLELGRKSIAHTQPRRIAARSVAERIAEELGVELGGLVGYQVRFTDKVSKTTQVKVMTDGILLAGLQNDRELKRYDTIIIDEAHERSLNIDFLLGYLKRLTKARSDLKVIITSATIDPESFSRHFDNAPIIEVSGRTYPIEVRYRPVAQDATAETDFDESHTADDYIDGIARALRELEREAAGDTLVFLSGESEIRDAQELIQGQITAGMLAKNTEVLPLYGRLSAAEQHRVFGARAAGVGRRVILATNVAETSLTIPGIKYVVDTGTARISRYSPRAKVQRLPIEAISQASANQRAGRAGRLSAGVVIRLYSEEDFKSRPEFTDPEILRTNLAAVILQAATIGIDDLSSFPFIQPPDSRGIKDGLGLLTELGALEPATASASPSATAAPTSSPGQGVRLTKLGLQLARLPIEPRFGRMLLEAQKHGVVREVLVIVAGLTIQDPRERPLEKREQANQLHARFHEDDSDFIALLNLYNYLETEQNKLSSSAFRRLCKKEYLNYLRIREWQDLIRQLKEIMKPLGLTVGPARVNPEGIHKALLSGLLSQLGLRQEAEKKQPGKKPRPSREYLGSNGKKFLIFPGSGLAKKPPDAIMSAELVETTALYARVNAAIDTAWAEEIAGDLCKRSYSDPHWEKKLGAVIGLERVVLFGLPIVTARKMQYSRVDPLFARELFIRHALVAGEWHSPQAFEKKNLQVIGQLAELAERTRNPRLVPDEEDLFRFFNNRVPLDVFSTRSFEGWWKVAKTENPELLTISQEKLFGERVEEPTEDDAPKIWSQGGQQLRLSYRFDPGAIDDGVTVEVPLPLLSTISPENFDWLVPSMRAELVTELIRTLPKVIRRNVVPAADWARKTLDLLPDEPQGRLTEVLAQTLQRLAGVKIEPHDFDLEKLPTSLRMTYRIVDDRGQELGLDNDVMRLRGKLQDQTRGAVAKVAVALNSDLERELDSWNFNSLPSDITLDVGENQVRAFPAIVRVKKGEVAVKVFSLREDQLNKHIFGVTELIRLAIPSVAKYVEQHLTAEEKLALAALQYGNVEAFVQDVYTALALQEVRRVEPNGLIFERTRFEAARDAVQAAALEQCFATAKQLAAISIAQREALKAITAASSMAFLTTLAEEKDHVAQLTLRNLVSEFGLARLPRIAVYLRAISHRVAKLAENPSRDQQAAREFEQGLAVFQASGGEIPLSREAHPLLVEARWLLEELRVSLFAQALGTTETVSVQRIKKLLHKGST
jgi:ATP-dependent helicase HrpA